MTKNKQKILLLTTGILIAIGIIIGVSYAWWSHVVSQEGINTIESTCLEIKLTDQNPISLTNAYPITDAEARILTPYTFTITNTCTTTVEYDVNLDIMESKVNNIDNRLNSEYVAVEFNGGEKKLLNTYESVETSYPGSDYTPVEARYLTSGELSANESKTYTIKLWMDESVTVENDAMNKNFISKIVVTAKQSHKVRLVDYIMSDTSKDFEEFTHEATYQTKALTDYRYTGANPNNYVCFGSEEEPCPSDNLYRIIGVIPTQSEIGGEYENRVKLVKANAYVENESGLHNSTKGYDWNANSSNNWTTASLNTQVLNGVYWNNLGEYQKYIASSVWHLGAANYIDVYDNFTSNQYYSFERGSVKSGNNGSLNIVTNIGLMYPSDYAYSIGKLYENQKVSDHRDSYVTSAWLYDSNGVVQWLISSENEKNDKPTVTAITKEGYVTASKRVQEYANDPYGWVPGYRITKLTFYLKTNVLYESGNGTEDNPYRISINE